MPNTALPNKKELADTVGSAKNGYTVNPDYNFKLTGPTGVRWYNQMRLSDATVAASLRVITLPIESARWYIQPASDRKADKKIADFVEDNLFHGMNKPWEQILSEIITLYLSFGRAPYEKVWEFKKLEEDDEQEYICIKKLGMIPAETVESWKLPNGEFGIQQSTINGAFEIPGEKLIVFVNQKEGENWEGISILRPAFKHWNFKEKMYQFQAMGAEKQSLGIPYAKHPNNATGPEKDKMEEVLQNVRANQKTFMMYGSDWEVGIMDMKSGSTKNLEEMIQHHDRKILQNVLAQFLSLGDNSSGSYALSKDHSQLFILSLESTAKYIAQNINKFLIKELVDYNFDVTDYPELKFDKIGNVDHNALSTSIQRLVQVGALDVDEGMKGYLREAVGLPEKDQTIAVDETMADQYIQELNDEMASISGESQEQEQPEVEDMTDEEIQKAAEELGIDIVMYGGVVGKPLSEETKRKISEALKRSKSSKTSKSKGKKKTNPEVAGKQKEIAKLRMEVKNYADNARRELLELKARGVKLDPKDMAKKQLELFDKKSSIGTKIEKLKAEIADIKSKSQPKDSKAVKAPKTAHNHETLPTEPKLLEALDRVLKAMDANI